MISTFKSLSKGAQRLIVTLVISASIINLNIVAPRNAAGEEFVIAFIVFMGLYSIVAMIGLWIYDGFQDNKNKKVNDNFTRKNSLIRHLIKKRVQENNTLTMSESEIDSLEGLKLDGMPESTIVSIVELYCALKGTGAQENEILQYIETAREGVRQSIGEMPSNLTLNSYINYRLKTEHNNTSGLTDKFISYAIKASLNHFES